MTSASPMKLRICTDFNTVWEDEHGEWYSAMTYNGQRLDAVENSLGLTEGMPVVLYYEDPTEEWEVDGTLWCPNNPQVYLKWHARVDWATYRRIRGD